MRKDLKPIVLDFALLVLGTTVGLAILEAGVRTYEYSREAKRNRAWQEFQDAKAVRTKGEVPLGKMIRISQDPSIIYELIPNLSGVTLKGKPVDINADGFRGPRYPRQPAPGTFRILGIGDSVMFGWGVREGDCYLSVLARMLSQREPNTRFEAINTAVPGYNTAMEVATLERKGLAFHPDLVIIGFVGNDLGLPNFIARRDNYLSLTRSFLAEFLRSRFSGGADDGPRPLIKAPRREDNRWFQDDPERVPPEYRQMVGIAGYRQAMRRLAQLSKEHDFQVLVVTHGLATHGPIPGFVADIGAELGLPVLGAYPVVKQYMQDHGIKRLLGSELTVTDTDAHPSAIQHRLIAEMICQYLLKNDRRLDRLDGAHAPVRLRSSGEHTPESVAGRGAP
jgi:lysophospholipase L1-like esterase